MTITPDHVAIIAILVTLAGLIWKGGRQSYRLDQTVQDVEALKKKHEEVLIKLDAQAQRISEYHTEQLQSNLKTLQAVNMLRSVLLRTCPLLQQKESNDEDNCDVNG